MVRDWLPSSFNIARYTSVKLNFFVENLVKGHIVTAGNGTSPIINNLNGFEKSTQLLCAVCTVIKQKLSVPNTYLCSDSITIKDSLHFDQMLWIEITHKVTDNTNAMIQKILRNF